MDLDTEIWVAAITVGGVIYAATIKYFMDAKAKREEAHKEEILNAVDVARQAAVEKERQAFYRQVTSPYYPVREWTMFVNIVKDLHANTEVDRVLVLVAVNGAEDPRHASVVWEYRTAGESYSYVDVPIDQDYVQRLLHIRREGKIRFKTAEVPGTLIGRFYGNEGVTESVWAMVGKRTSYTTSQVAYKYISVATHAESGFTNPHDIERQVDLLVSNFRPMLPVSGFGPI